MTRIDSNTVGTAINVQSQDENLGTRRVGKQQKTPMEIGLGAHLKTKSAAPVPEFASSAHTANIRAGRQALPLIADNVGVDYTAILGLIYKLSSEERKASSDAAVRDILSVAEKNQAAADDLRSGATLALAGGIVSSSMNIVAGGVSIAGSVKTFNLTSEVEDTVADSSESATNQVETVSSAEGQPLEDIQTTETTAETTAEDAGEAATDISEVEAKEKTNSLDADMKSSLDSYAHQNKTFMLSQRASAISLSTQGMAGILQGTGNVVGTAGKFGSDQFQAQSKDDEAMAQQRQAALEKEKDYGRSVSDDAKKIMDIYTQIDQSQHETMTKIMDTI